MIAGAGGIGGFVLSWRRGWRWRCGALVAGDDEADGRVAVVGAARAYVGEVAVSMEHDSPSSAAGRGKQGHACETTRAEESHSERVRPEWPHVREGRGGGDCGVADTMPSGGEILWVGEVRSERQA
eukprot:m.411465 g.411465  ORF g.411465 m.411465 type:complete len:126 (+) comp28666_c0_seq1:1379-1756(+)